MKFLHLLLIFSISTLIFVHLPISANSPEGYGQLKDMISFAATWVGIFIVFGLIKAWVKK